MPVKREGGKAPATLLGRHYDIADDGRFLINTELASLGVVAPITLIQNWKPMGR